LADGKYVAYYRVSTSQQGRSGLGLDAQREAVASFLNGGPWELIGEFAEVETGKGSNALSRRPRLREALDLARKSKATLVIAKLDRLARNVAFVATLMESKVDFVAVDMPQAHRLVVHIMAAFAEHEREMISQRTKAALAAAKARGKRLGTFGQVLASRNKAAALERLQPLANTLRALREDGLSVRRIAEVLNERGIASPAGARWHPASAHAALSRLGLMAGARAEKEPTRSASE
jgi:DNA invertase Pin-like site-specific DNA recombinase